jgi:hypothetical protein
MSKRTTGTLMIIGAPLLYITAILFKIVPFVTKLEMYGGCEPVKESRLRLIDGEMCWDAVRTVIDPMGMGFAVVMAGLFITGLILLGSHFYSSRSRKIN